jgi:hypothetical protein
MNTPASRRRARRATRRATPAGAPQFTPCGYALGSGAGRSVEPTR